MIDTIVDFSIFIPIYTFYENLNINEEGSLIFKEIKNREIFWLASLLEKHIKALLPALGFILVSPIFMSKKAKNLDDNKKMEVIKALTDIISIPFNTNEVKRISHQPISKSKLVVLISLTKEALPPKLKKIYNKILKYINKPFNERKYSELKKILEEIDITFASLKWEDYFEGFVMSEIFKRAFKDVLEKIVYMAYLEHAAGGVSRYIWGRNEVDKEYLRDVRKHEKEILEFLGTKMYIDGHPELIFELGLEYTMYYVMYLVMLISSIINSVTNSVNSIINSIITFVNSLGKNSISLQ